MGIIGPCSFMVDKGAVSPCPLSGYAFGEGVSRPAWGADRLIHCELELEVVRYI